MFGRAAAIEAQRRSEDFSWQEIEHEKCWKFEAIYVMA